jgi:hypothetical protein
MGATAVDVLNSLLQRNQRGPLDVPIGTQVDGSWRKGFSLPPISEEFISKSNTSNIE